MKLAKSVYNWAFKHLTSEGDTDLFPTPFEIASFKKDWKEISEQLAGIDIENYQWKGSRRFVVPKDVLAFRIATQLDPLDSLVLAAIIKKFGMKIEQRRIPYKDDHVFSYRFSPQNDGRFYGASTTWHPFWEKSLQKASAESCQWVAVTDITDYYNQIYHHVLENQLRESLPEFAWRAIKNFLNAFTHGVSRGIPVGPHAVHILAEAAFITTDNSLLSRGYNFCRYVDDIHIYCRSREEAEIALYDLAEILDKQQRLSLNKQKTRIVSSKEFAKIAHSMLIDRPINAREQKILEVISRHSHVDPYRSISIQILNQQDLAFVTQEILEELFDVYLSQHAIDYSRIGWLLRRLAQIGAPGALTYVLRNIGRLTPVLGDVAKYIMRTSPNYTGDIKDIGSLLIEAINSPIVRHSDYLQLVLIDLFGRIPELDHINRITSLYPSASAPIRREIILAAGAARQGHWIRERKDDFDNGDPWLRRAIIATSPVMPGDESEHWMKRIRNTLTGPEKIVVKWAFEKSNPHLKIGNIKLV
jgi:hypothetical protein